GPGQFRQGERNHGEVFRTALSGARRRRRGSPAARRAGRGRRHPGARIAKVSAPKQPATLQSRLAKLGLTRRFDLVLHLPLRYEDETRLASIAAASSALSEEPVQVEGKV